MTYKKTLPLILLIASLLVGCNFLKTTQKDIENADEIMRSDQENNGFYEAYSQDRFNELNGTEKFALFFHADWCPSCRKLEKDLKENMDVLNDHVVLEANYDREKELKKTYGITTQTTVVFFNMNGTIGETQRAPQLKHFEQFFK